MRELATSLNCLRNERGCQLPWHLPTRYFRDASMPMTCNIITYIHHRASVPSERVVSAKSRDEKDAASPRAAVSCAGQTQQQQPQGMISLKIVWSWTSLHTSKYTFRGSHFFADISFPLDAELSVSLKFSSMTSSGLSLALRPDAASSSIIAAMSGSASKFISPLDAIYAPATVLTNVAPTACRERSDGKR